MNIEIGQRIQKHQHSVVFSNLIRHKCSDFFCGFQDRMSLAKLVQNSQEILLKLQEQFIFGSILVDTRLIERTILNGAGPYVAFSRTLGRKMARTNTAISITRIPTTAYPGITVRTHLRPNHAQLCLRLLGIS
jgi:hypothetical protein